MNTPCPSCGADHGTHGPCPRVNYPLVARPFAPGEKVENTLTHVVWPPIGLTPEQFAKYGEIEALAAYDGPSIVDLWRGFDQKGLNDQLRTLGEWCLKRAREQHNPSTTRSMLRRKVDQILSPRPARRS